MVTSGGVERVPGDTKMKTRVKELQERVLKLESELEFCKGQLEVITEENKRLDSTLSHYTEKYDRLKCMLDNLVQERKSAEAQHCLGQPDDDARYRRPAGSIADDGGKQPTAVQPYFNPQTESVFAYLMDCYLQRQSYKEEEQEYGVTPKKRRSNWDILAASERNFAALSSFRSVQIKPQQESVAYNADTAIPRNLAGKKPVSVPSVTLTGDLRSDTAEESKQTKSKRKRERGVALETHDTKRFDEIRNNGSMELIVSRHVEHQKGIMGTSFSGTAGRTEIVGTLAAREAVTDKSQQAYKKLKGSGSASSNLQKQASSEDKGVDCLKHYRDGEDQKLRGDDANNCGQPAVVTTSAEAAPVILSKECEMCNEKFVCKKELRRHRKTCHTSKKCQQCGKQFSPPEIDEETWTVCLECSSLVNEDPDRMDASSEVETEIISSSVDSDSAEEYFECPLCQKTYRNERRLTKHLGRHSRF